MYGASYTLSHALRASPFVCAFDTLAMIIEFVHLQVLGCSFGMAAKHVWYSRFTMEPGWSLLDLLLERMEPSAGSEQPNSDAGSSSTDDGICGMGASEDASGQIPVETCEMSGAIPALISTRTPSCIPNEELDDTDIQMKKRTLQTLSSGQPYA